MKQKIKENIIRFVKWLLNYTEPIVQKPFGEIISIRTTRKIVNLRLEFVINTQILNKSSFNLKRDICNRIAKALETSDLIDISMEEYDKNLELHKIKAKLDILEVEEL